MKKFTAKYTQLPNFEHEYMEIINYIYDGIPKEEVENFISGIKGSVIKAKYKHRTHLENLGLFYTNKDGGVYLSPYASAIKSGAMTLKAGLLEISLQNHEIINLFMIIERTGYFQNKVNKKSLASYLNENFYLGTDANTIYRYLREIINLFNIIGIENFKQALKIEDSHILVNNDDFGFIKASLNIEKYYLKCCNGYGEPIAIEEILSEIQKGNEILAFNEEKFLYWLFSDLDNKYKFTFVKLPNWSTESKSYEISGNLYTHLIIEY
ncbi:hypothetical protein [Bacillus cereus group sp. BfR-BA-01346]|uniref:hypothetical protein n=1 Tax=Bacillus cereus group sp. BfR-BA-01346 TaxID=2920309 RepID=UPI001F57E9A0|nr:hypothetical protein [Bacillus cereus group sp. BfR-BA-01346]